ncbi:MAG: hypothetical protein IJ681_03170 [Bacteroidales bacterium]|nr:hypothetical protein [Bacteroidales bacterium]
MILILLSPDIVSHIKSHSLGWFLTFSLGMYVAQNKDVLKFLDNIFLSILLLGLLIFSSVNKQTWIFSETISVLFLLSIRKYLTNKLFIFIGGISSFIYVIHPLIRNFWLLTQHRIDYINGNCMIIFLSILIYFSIVITISYGYSKMFPKIMKALNIK